MSGLEFTIDVTEWEQFFEGARRRLRFLKPAHEKIGELLVDITKQNIETAGGNEPWPPLAESTLLARARNPSGLPSGAGRHIYKRDGRINNAAARAIASARPLIWSGALLRSIKADPRADYVDVGTPLVKGGALFFGSARVPARYPFRFRVGDAEKISGIFVNHIFQKKAA